MQEGKSGIPPVKKSVAPFSADHGVNPGWGVYEERPAIPVFNGVAEIAKLAMMFTLWARVENFIYNEVGMKPLASSKEEKKHRAVLLESETYLVALLCLLNNDYYSAGGLVDAMVGVDASADQRGNARKRILNRTLPIVGDRYGLIDYSERHMGNAMEYSICRSERLVYFAETHLVTSFTGLIGGADLSQMSNTPADVKATVKKKATRKTRSVTSAKAIKNSKKAASVAGSKSDCNKSTSSSQKANSKIAAAKTGDNNETV